MIQKLNSITTKSTPGERPAKPNLAGIQNAKPRKSAQVHYRTCEPDLPAFEFKSRLIDSADELEAIVDSWKRLAEVAMRPNLCFDPGFLIPAFKHLNNGTASLLVVEAPQRINPDAQKVLCALMPVARRRFYGYPLSCLEIWKHDQCFDCTPLIRRDCGREVLSYIFETLSKDTGASLLSFDTVAGEGEFQEVLTDVLYRNSATVFRRDAFTRACFCPMQDAETYIKTKVSKSCRKNTLRLERKLGKDGELEVTTLADNDSAAQWTRDFLSLEASGWKGQGKTALASQESNCGFFEEMSQRMAATGKLAMLKIAYRNQPIGMLFDLHHEDYAIAFKTAFDESYAEYSPGLIAELHNIKRLHDCDVRMMDSCADPDHPMINRVWKDRNRYQSFVVAIGGQLSRFAVASMPLVQATGKLFKK